MVREGHVGERRVAAMPAGSRHRSPPAGPPLQASCLAPRPHLRLGQLAEHHHLVHAVEQLGPEVGLAGEEGGWLGRVVGEGEAGWEGWEGRSAQAGQAGWGPGRAHGGPGQPEALPTHQRLHACPGQPCKSAGLAPPHPHPQRAPTLSSSSTRERMRLYLSASGSAPVASWKPTLAPPWREGAGLAGCGWFSRQPAHTSHAGLRQEAQAQAQAQHTQAHL